MVKIAICEHAEYFDINRPCHWYGGSLFGKTLFVGSGILPCHIYDGIKVHLTDDPNKATLFYKEEEVDKIMRHLVTQRKVWTISLWFYNGDKLIAQCVHYPNTHWSCNKNIEPSLLKTSVSEWHKKYDGNNKWWDGE